MKKVLVTGATGFIGNHVVNRLLQEGYEVIATSLDLGKAKSFKWFPEVEYVPLDFKTYSSQTDYYTFFKKPDVLIHLAWEGLPNYKSEFHINENLPRHYAFLNNLIQNGIRDVTISGTCFEYGLQEGCLSEDLPARPINPYAIAKDKLRLLLTELNATISFSMKWIRLFYTYGEGQSSNSLLSQLQLALDKGDRVFNMSPGDQLRDYLEVTKVAEYITRIATQRKETGIINCCSGEPISVRQLVTDYLKTKRKDIELNLGFYPYSDIEPKSFWGDTKRLKTILADG